MCVCCYEKRFVISQASLVKGKTKKLERETNLAASPILTNELQNLFFSYVFRTKTWGNSYVQIMIQGVTDR